jgi:hypothetical protein
MVRDQQRRSLKIHRAKVFIPQSLKSFAEDKLSSPVSFFSPSAKLIEPASRKCHQLRDSRWISSSKLVQAARDERILR